MPSRDITLATPESGTCQGFFIHATPIIMYLEYHLPTFGAKPDQYTLWFGMCQRIGNQVAHNPHRSQRLDRDLPLGANYLEVHLLLPRLVCKHLPEMISYARRHKIRIFLSSNLNILDEKMAEDLIESKLDYLIVSLDGTTQESYEKYRVGGDFDKVINNLRLIIDKKIQKNTPYPRIVIQPVILKHNEQEVPKLSALADSLGVKMFIRQGMLGGEGHSPPVTKDHALARKWLSQNRKYHKDYDYLSDKPYLKTEPCFYLWKAVAINWDGTVFPCCWLYENKYSVGNIMEQDFETIWNNEVYVSSRSLFARRKSTFLKSSRNLPKTICYRCKIFRHNLNEQQ